jgi:exonuclease V gamma subunit
MTQKSANSPLDSGIAVIYSNNLEALNDVLFVHNPWQHYWADIIEDKELLKAKRHR